MPKDILDSIVQGKLKINGKVARLSTQPTPQNPVLSQLSSHKEIFKKKDITQRLQDMHQKKLLAIRQVRVNRYNQLKKGYIMNDYHDRQTNPGYSRNKTGGFYTT